MRSQPFIQWSYKLWHCEAFNGHWTIRLHYDRRREKRKNKQNETNRNHHYHFPISFAILLLRITLFCFFFIPCSMHAHTNRICSFIGWFMHIRHKPARIHLDAAIFRMLRNIETQRMNFNSFFSHSFIDFCVSVFLFRSFAVCPAILQMIRHWSVVHIRRHCQCVFIAEQTSLSSRSVCMHVMVFVCNLVGCWWKIWILCAIGYQLKLACTTHIQYKQ